AKNDEAFRKSVQTGNLDIVKFLIENGADIHLDNDFAIRKSAELGNLELLEILIKQGTSFENIDPKFYNNIAEFFLSNKGIEIFLANSKRIIKHIYNKKVLSYLRSIIENFFNPDKISNYNNILTAINLKLQLELSNNLKIIM
ncbi:MAG: hypothetical protein ACTSX0_03755, partial [Promethearchaeota archaeon]